MNTKTKNQNNQTWYFYLILDIISFLLAVMPELSALGITAYFAIQIIKLHFGLFLLILMPLSYLLFTILNVFLIRLLIPKLKPGICYIGFNKMTFTFFMHFALNRVIKVSGLRYLINAFYIFKYLMWRALGGKIAYSIHTPMEFVFTDCALLEIGSGCTFGEGVQISCHIISGNRLYLKKVKIGKNVFLGKNVSVGPGSTIGNGAKIGSHNIIYSDQIENDYSITDFEWQKGNPEKLEKRQ